MNSQHSRVRSWLESLFPEGDVPSYEVTEANLAALSSLADLAEKKRADARVLREAAQVQSREYRAEAEAKARRVHKCSGITPTAG